MATAENTTPKTTRAASDKVAPRQQSAVSNLTLGNADDALSLAKELQKFVKANNLTTKIQNKDFPNVEAWQFAGSLLGLSPMLESIEDKSTPDEIKWNATVNLLSIKTGNVIGRGFATCSNKESTKKFFADYAICSMAQTRAVGKAYRLSLGWLMKAAGYEATPAEEMSDLGTEAAVVESPKKPAAEASAPASAPLALSTGAAPAASVDELDTVREHIRQEVRSNHLTPWEQQKTLAALPNMSLEVAKKCLSKILDTVEYRVHPDALPKTRHELRAFSNAHSAALGEDEYKRLNLRAGALTVTAVDLIQEVQEAEQRLKMPQQAAA